MSKNQKEVFNDLFEKFGIESNDQNETLEKRIEEIKTYASTYMKKIEMETLIPEIIEKESQVFCPNCGLGGRKDLECTHITCPKCYLVYCYVCGKSENEFSTMAFHNEDWESNSKRCPTSFYMISIIDERYPNDEEGAMNFFHDLKIKKKLKEVFEILEFDEMDIESIEDMNKNMLKSYNLYRL